MQTPTVTIHALVVDDDPLIVGVVCAFLKKRGYVAESAPDGEAALAKLTGGSFNLVITDRDMPRMDGLALCRAIRDLPGDSYIYSIMLTSSGQEETLVAAMEAGVDDFVAKPVRLGELGARLRAAERVLGLEAGLAARNRSLSDAYAQLSRELELARSLQLGQLPEPASFGTVRFDWVFEASGFVGGDTFDYFQLDENTLCFYLADVSGHGVAAAMMAFNAQHQLLAATQQTAGQASRRGPDLATPAVAAVTEYNRRFLQMKETSLYLTMAYGLVDTTNGQCAMVHAGHPAALYSPTADAPFAPVGESGLPIGILPQPDYMAHTLTLARGARLVLYSDGITDCESPLGEMFGLQRLQDLLARCRHVNSAQTGSALRMALREWRGAQPFEDDVTFLALEVR